MCDYLGVAMSDAEYASKFRTNFTLHAHPGPLTTHPQNAMQYQSAAKKDFTQEVSNFSMSKGKLSKLHAT